MEAVIQQCRQDEGRLTRINRVDRGANYRAPGEYELNYLTPCGVDIPVKLNVLEEDA